ncbi:NAD(P)-binding domain-containing protein [Streptacidiphilus rugosus]|uniref:NAD(P)-binding domain-containing protein n=1 Tax=Streptacidiphilus rugosus TaxID=405783 RepID=UPI00068EF688|nr:NAD(P)-binding domain-containing protein [Streptacidiphilus rugosus]
MAVPAKHQPHQSRPEEHDVVIVGAGQAGLSIAHELAQADVEHVVLERGRVAQSWRRRWDSFCLVIPNWTVRLRGAPYTGSDRDGFMARDAIVDHLVRYAAGGRAPVREGVEVTRVDADPESGFRLATSDGLLRARKLVLASGGYQRPHRPAGWRSLPPSVVVFDAEEYTRPQALPPGGVLVVGSGQTGCQLAEELVETGRRVHLACGRAPWIPRRVEGRDIISWLVEETPFFVTKVGDLPDLGMRLRANLQCSGRDGGHDLNYRTLQALGVTLAGHFLGADDGRAHFADDLPDSVAFGDARHAEIGALLTSCLAKRGERAPQLPPPPPFAAEPVTELDLDGVGAVVFTSGYRPDFVRWVGFPEAFDATGFPLQTDGCSTVVPGLHFMGVHWQRTRQSATFLGVAEDAAVLAERLTDRAAPGR